MVVAVFGGSFDPPHRGHKKVVEEALKTLDIDKLFVIPTYLNPFKNSFYHDEITRYKLVKEMVKEFKKVEVLDIEIKQKKAIPTYETIKFLKRKYDIDKIYLIIGADNLKSLDKWYNHDKLKKMVEFVVATRDNIEIPKKYKKLNVDEDISSTQIRSKSLNRVEEIVKFLDEKKAENIQVFDMRDSDYFVDDVIIATTISDKHGYALVDYLKPLLKKLGEKNISVELSDSWSVVDIGDMLIHLMSSDYRAKYNIEEFLSKRETEK
jgi:nicotinate-nucleotide adenylyltransferase